MNTTEKRNALIGAVVLGLIIIGLALWYMASNPPKPSPIGQMPAQEIPEGAYEKKVIADEGDYYTAYAAYPGNTPLMATAGAEADQRVVAKLTAFAEERIAEFKTNSGVLNLTQEDIEMMGLGADRKYAFEMDFDVSESPKAITYVYTIYEDTGGAHPNGYYRTFSFDKATGAEITLSTLFTGNYLARLSEISRAKLPAIISEKSGAPADMEYLESGTTPTAESFQNFALQGDLLVLIFPPYQVGPYALGTQFVEIPLTDIADILAPAYRP